MADGQKLHLRKRNVKKLDVISFRFENKRLKDIKNALSNDQKLHFGEKNVKKITYYNI